MGVAQYQLSPALPAQLQQELPTVEDFAREFPLMSVVKLRIEIERAVRTLATAKGVEPGHPTGIGNMLRDLNRRGLAPASTARFLDTLRVMNEASHGVDVDSEAAARAVEVGTAFLAELIEHGRND
ncbi:hypothetical protein [Bradyrhizobium sp. 5.13L]